MSKNSYGRRTWDVDEYAKRAQDEKRHRNRGPNHGGKSQNARDFFSARNEQIDKIDSFNQISFVSSLNSKDAGFYCDVCNRKFKDNLKFIDHLNSTEHLVKSGFDDSSLQSSFSLSDVIQKLNSIKENKLKVSGESGSDYVDFNDRIKLRKQFDENLRQKKKLKRQLKKQKNNSTKENNINGDDDDGDMMKAMGFAQFGSSN